MKKARTIIAIVVLLAAIGTACYFAFFSRNIPANPPGTLGNTASNLLNRGLFCDDGEKVFFANAYDGYRLYSMNPDESGMKRLSNSEVSYINCGGDFVFYYQASSKASNSFTTLFRINGIYRAKKDGKKAVCIQKVVSPSVSLWENDLIYMLYDTKTGTSLHKSSIDKKDEGLINDKELIDPSCINNGRVIYAGQGKDRSLYSLDLKSGAVSPIYNCDAYNPVISGEWIYYMNILDDYHIYRYSMATGQDEQITSDRVDCYNITPEYIYYQKSDSKAPALMRVRLDGSSPEIVQPGVYTNINASSRYIYFNAFGQDTPVYHTPVSGPVQVSMFAPPVGE